jgi:hypothetical protein
MKLYFTLALAIGLSLGAAWSATAAKEAPPEQAARTTNDPQVCLANCRARLHANGTWSKLPRGYCRNECNAH